jgi:hypothetical protein
MMDYLSYPSQYFRYSSNNSPHHTAHSTPQDLLGYSEHQSHGHYFDMPSHSTSMMTPNGMPEKTESKPRLAKEEVDVLEGHFQAHNKPSSGTKRELASRMNVDIARINVSEGTIYRPSNIGADSIAELVPEPTCQGQTREETAGTAAARSRKTGRRRDIL